MGKLKTATNAFMRLSSEVKKGMSKAKNAPAREYAKDPKGKGVGKAATKGLPEKGSMGAKEAPKLNAGAQKAKDLADSKRATTASREAAKRANSPRKAAVDAGLATKKEAISNAQSVRGARNAVRRNAGTSKNIPAKKGKLTTAQKVVGSVVGSVAAGGVAINSDRKLKAATASSAKAGSSRRDGAPMGDKKAPAKMAPASAISRGGGSAVKNKPSVNKAPAKKATSKASSAPSKASTPTMSPTPTIGGKTFEQMQSDYVKSGQQSYDEHKAYFNSGEVQKVNKAPAQPKQKWYKRKYK